jgi:hypothetical protein
MNIQRNLPTTNNLWSDPQLAILAVLDTTLEMAACALQAQHPDMCDDERPYWIRADLSSAMAEEVISYIHSLRKALDGYWYMLAAEIDNMPDPDEGFPF